MEKIVTLFHYLLIDNMKSRESTKNLDFCYPPKNATVDLTANSDSKNEYLIDPDKPPPCAAAKNETSLP